MGLLEVNLFSLTYLLAAGVFGILYYNLSKTKPKNPARIAYNRSMLAVAFWMFADFLEYSATDPVHAELFLIAATLFTAITLYFVLTAGLLLAGKNPRLIRYIPLIVAVILAPFFEVQPAVFTPFDDKFNLPLGLWLGLEFIFFIAFPAVLYLVRRRVSDKRLVRKLDSLIHSSVFVIFFTMLYYVYHLFVLLPPLTWVAVMGYAGFTYRVFK